MKTYQIAQTDLQVSRLAYGTWHMGGSWDTTPLTNELKDRAERLILTAVDQGINFIDLADIYTMGKSDQVVGHVIKNNPGLRNKVYLQAKSGIILGHDPVRGGPGRYDFSYDHLVSSVETTLKNLNTDYVDVLALHRPDPLMEPEEVARAFDHLHSSGKVRHFGVSNHTIMQMELLRKHIKQPLVVNQLELNLLHSHLISDGIQANMSNVHYASAAGLLDYCRLHDITIQAWSPVAGGKLFNPAADAPDNIQAVAKEIEELAAKYATTVEAIALAWLLRHPAGIQPIVGTLKPERIIASCPADNVELTRQEWYSLFIAARGERVP
ncbi:MAG: aldo/keto reductase [Chloroflexota bacterium]